MGVSPCLGGNLDVTLGNNADVLLSLKARSGENFQGEFKDLGEFAYYTIRQCFPQ